MTHPTYREQYEEACRLVDKLYNAARREGATRDDRLALAMARQKRDMLRGRIGTDEYEAVA